MACETIQQSEVNFTLNNTNLDLLKAALEDLGLSVSIAREGAYLRFSGYMEDEEGSSRYVSPYVEGSFNTTTSKFTARYRESDGAFDVNAVKKAYSRQVIKHASKRFGWELKQTGSNKGKLKKRV